MKERLKEEISVTLQKFMFSYTNNPSGFEWNLSGHKKYHSIRKEYDNSDNLSLSGSSDSIIPFYEDLQQIASDMLKKNHLKVRLEALKVLLTNYFYTKLLKEAS